MVWPSMVISKVFPARAGMIPESRRKLVVHHCIPRESGDDPAE